MDEADSNYTSLKVYHYIVTESAAGLWNYSITSTSATEGLMIQVSGQTVDNQEPIRADAYGQILTGYQYGEYMFMYTRVRQGYDPVIGADVIATVTRPSPCNDDVQVQLTDDGNGESDMIKDDGTYSGILTSYCGIGRYTFDVSINNGDQTYVISSVDTVSVRRKRDTQLNPSSSLDTGEDSTGTFVRSASGGSVSVTANIPEDVDFFPPGKINDLTCTASNMTASKTFSLVWTAPGSDLYTGTAEHYELRFSTNRSLLTDDLFDNDTLLTYYNVTSGDLTPLVAGTQQNVTVTIFNSSYVPYYFALRATDSTGNVGKISNVASGYFVEQSSDATKLSSAMFVTLVSLICVMFLI
jgi:hypothetical protein